MAGQPAVTRHRFGQGWVFYVGTDCAENGFHETLASAAGATGNLAPLMAAPYGVEVTSREDTNTVYYFLLNLTETAHKIPLPRPMTEMVGEQNGLTEVSLGPLGVAVLASERS